MKQLSIGYSPCPNDTFIFYAMIHDKIDTHNLKFNEVLLDVETLNVKAKNEELDITKVSYAAYGHLRNNYSLLKSGGALGRGCGPLIIAKDKFSLDELSHKKIAIPGKLTTAYLLLKLFDNNMKNTNIVSMPFDAIMNSVVQGEVDAGLIIHESRFTYSSLGLMQILDLGQWWEDVTGLPIPLGGIIAKRSLGKDMLSKVNNIIKQSVQYALINRAEPLEYVKQHSQELTDNVILQHIDLYVNDFSVDFGDEGDKAVTELISRAEHAGIIPKFEFR